MKKVRLLVTMILTVLVAVSVPQFSSAASKYVYVCGIGSDGIGKKKVGDITFIVKQYQKDSSYYYKIIMKKNGKTKTIEKKMDTSFVTNGEILYYAKEGKKNEDYESMNTIYKYIVKTGKKEKIAAGINYTVCGCSGKYLYCGTNNGADGVDLYAVNVKTKKKKHMTDVVGGVYVSGNRVVTSTNSGDVGNYPIYSFKLNGSHKKKITDGILLSVKKKKIYYGKVKSDGKEKFKVYSCSLTGKNKKALTGWIDWDKVPKEYW